MEIESEANVKLDVANIPNQQKCHDPYLRCALYGAAQAALGVKGCCVLAHSPQGCFQLVGSAFGWQDADYTETVTLCTKLCEDEIVFGGEGVLTRTIREAQESLDIPVMFIVTACGPEIVGDDIVAVADSLRSEVDFPIVPISSAGFRGDQNYGTDIALQAILDHLVPSGNGQQKIPGSVCLVAPHANANPTWMGDLAWVQSILVELGAKKVMTLTHNTLLSEFESLPQFEGCLLLSHDAGQSVVDILRERYGISQWCQDLPLPVGFTNTRNWLLALAEQLGVVEAAKHIIAQGEDMVVKACRRKGLEQSAMHRATAAIVADATVGIPLLRFITEDLEMIPKLVCLRSGQTGTENMLKQEIQSLNLEVNTKMNCDVYQTKTSLAEVKPEMVLGSNIERHAVEELDIPYVFRLVTPVSKFRMTDRAYWGYTGILNLIEIMQNDWWDRYRSKKRRYKARW
jgi:nitrogenase molybdenum-iron protein alpha/beta subunit